VDAILAAGAGAGLAGGAGGTSARLQPIRNFPKPATALARRHAIGREHEIGRSLIRQRQHGASRLNPPPYRCNLRRIAATRSGEFKRKFLDLAARADFAWKNSGFVT
jgi:hypothetical protein